jgi:hypothetical protein
VTDTERIEHLEIKTDANSESTLLKAVVTNSILINDALGIQLRKLHQQREVNITQQHLEIIKAAKGYTDTALLILRTINQ